jgi:hypothetical protein
MRADRRSLVLIVAIVLFLSAGTSYACPADYFCCEVCDRSGLCNVGTEQCQLCQFVGNPPAGCGSWTDCNCCGVSGGGLF